MQTHRSEPPGPQRVLSFRANANETGPPARNKEIPTMNVRAMWPLVLTTILSVCIPTVGWAAIAVDDSYSTPRTTPLSVSAPGILGNDECEACIVASVNGVFFEGTITFDSEAPSDSDTDPLGSLPSGATLTVSSDGSFTYDGSAVAAEVTSDSFTYQAEDSRGLSEEATVTITLTETPENSAPTANDDTYSVELGAVLTVSAPGLLENDTDADGDPLTVALVNGAELTVPSSIDLSAGTLTFQSNDGSFTYEPSAEAVAGTDEGFSYTASDGTELSNSAIVGISLTESTTGDTVARVTFDDVAIVLLDSEIGRSDVDQLDIGAAPGTSAQVGGAGLPSTTDALVLRNSVASNGADARELFKGCERMALLAQAQPVKYDLVVEVSTATPGSTFSVGGDGEVIVEVAETRVKCWMDRVTDPVSR